MTIGRHSRTATLLAALAISAGFGYAALAAPRGAQTFAPQGQQGGGRGGGQGQTPVRDAQGAKPVVATGVISGVVSTDGTGTPVRRARVSLNAPELRGGRSTMTNDDGAFEFVALPAGRYTVTASKNGYVNLPFGAKRPGRPGTPIQLAEGAKMERANIALPRGSVVTGIVLDDYGEPAPGTQVRVLRYVMRNGERTLQQAGQDQSDDRGMYRIYGLQPGEYLVSAAPRNQSVNDIRQTISAEIESLMQQLQGSGLAEALAGRGGRGGAGGAAMGGGGRGGRGGGGIAGIDVTQAMAGGRGGDMLGRMQALQEQLAEQQTEQPTQYAPVYYPGTASPAVASTVSLAVGEERSGVDFRLVLVPTSRVRGMIQSAYGMPQGTQVTLVPLDQIDMPSIPGAGGSNSRVNQNGEFTFNNVAPGQYRVLARGTLRQQQEQNAQQQQGGRGGRGGRGGGTITDVLWGSTDISVTGQDVEGVVVSLQEGMTITGTVSFQGAAATPPTDLTTVRVTLSPRGSQQGGFDMGGIPPAQVEASGRFTIVGVTPGRYSINANVGGGRGGGGGGRGGGGQTGGSTASWSLKSANVAGRDALDFGIQVEPNMDIGGAMLVFGDRTQGVSGVIQDTLGQPTADYTIILFPSDRNYWVPQSRRIRSVRPGTDGQFSFGGLPVGDYRLTAVTDVEQGEWFNPDFLAELMNASVPVTVNEGEQKTQNIKVAGG